MTDSKRVTREELAVTLSAGLDVERLARAMNRAHLRSLRTGDEYDAESIAAEYARLTDPDQAKVAALDVERLARAVLDTPAASPGSDLCRYCENIDGHAFDCVVVIARKYARLTEADR